MIFLEQDAVAVSDARHAIPAFGGVAIPKPRAFTSGAGACPESGRALLDNA
jgi:hypothetical protein